MEGRQGLFFVVRVHIYPYYTETDPREPSPLDTNATRQLQGTKFAKCNHDLTVCGGESPSSVTVTKKQPGKLTQGATERCGGKVMRDLLLLFQSNI